MLKLKNNDPRPKLTGSYKKVCTLASFVLLSPSHSLHRPVHPRKI